MKTYTTLISPEEQSLLLILLNDFMNGAYKEWTNRDFAMSIRNKSCSIVLTPKEVETLASLLSKYDIFTDHYHKLMDWIIEN